MSEWFIIGAALGILTALALGGYAPIFWLVLIVIALCMYSTS